MQRRSFFQALVGGAGAAIVPAAAARPVPHQQFDLDLVYPSMELVVYRGFLLRWSGWKQDVYSDRLYGQWTAGPYAAGPEFLPGQRLDSDFPRFYSAVPGKCEAYMRGHTFNTYALDGIIIDYSTPNHVRLSEKLLGRVRLENMIDSYLASKLDQFSWVSWGDPST